MHLGKYLKISAQQRTCEDGSQPDYWFESEILRDRTLKSSYENWDCNYSILHTPLHCLHLFNIWICKLCLNCGLIRIAVTHAEMLAVLELAVRFDDCVCWSILTSSFHDWLDFMEEMMKGATVHTISYITSSLHTHTHSLGLSLFLRLFYLSP